MEEARGIADGANVDIGEIMVLNCRYEITKFPKEKECTSFSLLSEATKNKSTYVGQNWDYRIGVFENTVLVHIENPDGTKIFGMTEAGQVIRNGFNSNGIGLCANNLQSIYDKSGIGLPVTFVRREILNCKTFEEASSLLENYKRVVSCNYMLASIEDKAMDFEVYPMGNDKIFPVNGIVAHGNHFVVQPEIHALDQSPRGDRLSELLAKKHGEIDVEYIKKCLSDHENYPKAICRHPDNVTERVGRRSITVASVIYDLNNGEAHVCAGPPCEGEYIKYKL
jgi:isopenicillin-N N-acyltransferase-like protein